MEKIKENPNSLFTVVCENSDGIIDLYKVVCVLYFAEILLPTF